MRFTFFSFNDPATTEIYTLSLHDALPIFRTGPGVGNVFPARARRDALFRQPGFFVVDEAAHHAHELAIGFDGCGGCGHDSRSEEHTSELQSHVNLVCRLLLEKKKKKIKKK